MEQQDLSHIKCISSKSLAALLGVTTQTVRDWRTQSRGPAYIKDGNLVLYRIVDVTTWLTDHHVGTKEQEVAQNDQETR